MNLNQQAIEILRQTGDGNTLSPAHLSLVQAAVNDRITQAGQVAFAELYADVTEGRYQAPFLFGIQHLRRDHEGYVYWRGQHVEHYSHQDPEQMRAAAVKLAENCRALELKGFPVNARTAISQELLEAPSDTPWLKALCRYYAFFLKDETVCVVFYKEGAGLEAIALHKQGDALVSDLYEDGYSAYHGTIAQGYRSAGCGLGYAQVVALLERSGLTPSEIQAAIAN